MECFDSYLAWILVRFDSGGDGIGGVGGGGGGDGIGGDTTTRNGTARSRM